MPVSPVRFMPPQRPNPWAQVGDALTQVMFMKIGQKMRLEEQEARRELMKTQAELREKAMDRRAREQRIHEEGMAEKKKAGDWVAAEQRGEIQKDVANIYADRVGAYKAWRLSDGTVDHIPAKQKPPKGAVPYKAPPQISEAEKRQQLNTVRKAESVILNGKDSDEAKVAMRDVRRYSDAPYTYLEKDGEVMKYDLPTWTMANGSQRQLTAKDIYDFAKEKGMSYEQALEAMIAENNKRLLGFK